jgi:tellurite resistance protein TerC
MTGIAGPAVWGVFAAVIVVMLVIDLGIFHRKPHVIGFREAAVWSGIWIFLALSFNVLVFVLYGSGRAFEFLQAWMIEKALSVDNIFVFLAIFAYFGVARRLQHRVLFWGILGALVTRGIFIWAGAALLHSFHWVMYVFGAFLLLTAVKMLLGNESEVRPDKNPVLRVMRRLIPVTREYAGVRFLVKRDGRIMATPLLMVLVVVEATDVVFAVDSIPAVFGVTSDVFIVYTSNIFAILGLRALSFLVADLVRRLRYLKVGLSLVLAFIGVKMLIGQYVNIPDLLSLGVVAFLLFGSAVASLLIPAPPEEAAPAQPEGHSGPVTTRPNAEAPEIADSKPGE